MIFVHVEVGRNTKGVVLNHDQMVALRANYVNPVTSKAKAKIEVQAISKCDAS